MKPVATALPDLRVVALPRHVDARGALVELGSAARWAALGLPPLVHDVVSVSRRGVVRGLHLQDPNPQGKLVCVVAGRIWDVAVDLRPGAPTFLRWHARELAAPALDTNAPAAWEAAPWEALWIPPGFAHGFLALSDAATVLYRCSAPYAPAAQHTIRWDDPTLAIPWPLTGPALLSDKDRAAPDLATWLAR